MATLYLTQPFRKKVTMRFPKTHIIPSIKKKILIAVLVLTFIHSCGDFSDSSDENNSECMIDFSEYDDCNLK